MQIYCSTAKVPTPGGKNSPAWLNLSPLVPAPNSPPQTGGAAPFSGWALHPPRERTARFVQPEKTYSKNRALRPSRYIQRKAITRLLDDQKATGTGKKPAGYSAIGCGVWAIHGYGNDAPHNATVGGSYIGGRFRCNTVHCPACAALKAADYRGYMQSILFPKMEVDGLTGDLLTFTLAHSMRSDWTQTRKALTAAFSHMHNRLRRIFKRLGVVGFIKALEAPVGFHGIHPHYHILLVRPRSLTDEQLIELQDAIRSQWEKSLAACGGSCNEHGFDYKADCMNDYIAKITASYELAAHDTKTAKKSGRTFIQLLNDYIGGDTKAGQHFVRWSAAMSGSNRFDTHALSKSLGVISFVEWKEQQKEEHETMQSEFDALPEAEKITLSIPQDVVNVLANSPVRNYYPFVLKYGERLCRTLTAENKQQKILQWKTVFDRCLAEHRRYMAMRPYIMMTPERVDEVMRLAESRPLVPSEISEFYAARIFFYSKPAQVNKLRRIFQKMESKNAEKQ